MTDYSKMSDFEINSAVAKSIGGEILFDEYEAPYRLEPCSMSAYSGRDFDEVEFSPCTNPEDAWTIINESKINIDFRESLKAGPMAKLSGNNGLYAVDKNPLRAAMIVFLMMKEAGNV